jgi:hypothetical protein
MVQCSCTHVYVICPELVPRSNVSQTELILCILDEMLENIGLSCLRDLVACLILC